MGEFISVVGLQTPVKHVVSVIDINGKFELADNNTKHIFNSYDELIKHLETKYENQKYLFFSTTTSKNIFSIFKSYRSIGRHFLYQVT